MKIKCQKSFEAGWEAAVKTMHERDHRVWAIEQAFRVPHYEGTEAKYLIKYAEELLKFVTSSAPKSKGSR